MNQPGFFDVDRRLAAISAKGDPLDTIDAAVPWKSFRVPIEAAPALANSTAPLVPRAVADPAGAPRRLGAGGGALP